MTSMASADPSGEMLRLIDELAPQSRPHLHAGVWFSKNGSRALLLAQTTAAGSDIDAQQAALDLIRESFAKAAAGTEARDTPW